MIKYILGLFLFFSSSAFAVNYPAAPPGTVEYSASGQAGWSSDKAGACSAASAFAPPADFQYGAWYVSGNQCLTTKGNYFEASITSSTSHRCLANDVLSGDTCINNTPPPPPPAPKCVAGQLSTINVNMDDGAGGPTGPMARPNNINGCSVEVANVLSCWQYNDTHQKVCRIEFYFTGSQADSGSKQTNPDTAPTSSPKTPYNYKADASPNSGAVPSLAGKDNGGCPSGTVQGGLDSGGTIICMGTGSNPSTTPVTAPPVTTNPPVVTNNADGSTTTVKTTSVSNADGSTTTKADTTVQKPDGSTVTTSNTTTSTNTKGENGVPTPGVPGIPSTSPGSPDPSKDLCAANPTLNICRNSTVSGTCAATACTGDAIQCATLRAAELMRCKEQADSDAIAASSDTALGRQIAAGNDPQQSAINTMMTGKTVDLSNPNLDTAGFLGGGACLPARTITVMGRSVVMEFTSICNTIVPIRYAVMACASILAYLICARSVVGA